MKPALRQQLQRLAMRLTELDAHLADPALSQDIQRYRSVAREQAEAAALVQRLADYEQREADLAAARDLLAQPGQDADMAEMAREEITAAEADLELPQLWKKSSNGQGAEYTQVKLSILLTDGGLVAVGVQDEGRPVQLRDTFVVGKPRDGGSQNVALFPIPSEKRVEVIRIKPTLAQETLQVYVLPCQVSSDTRGADVSEGNDDWRNLQTQLPSAPPQFHISRLDACPNASDVNWPDIYSNAKALSVSKNDKRLYGTVGSIDKGQWYRLDIPYATGL